MPATVIRINTPAGTVVKRGETLLVLEAMKMELPIRATEDGTVKTVNCRIGELVQAGVFGTRAEAAAFLIDEGIKTQGPLFERVEQKLAEIERLRAELRGMVGDKKE